MNQTSDTQSKACKKREEHLSKDGQWRSFPKMPHLLQYVSNGYYYGRIKVGGKVIRESTKTDMPHSNRIVRISTMTPGSVAGSKRSEVMQPAQ